MTPDPTPQTEPISPAVMAVADVALTQAVSDGGLEPVFEDPTPQPPDHGAAGFCTDHAQGEQGWVTHRWANKAARHTADETCPGCPTPSTPQPAPDERTETVARVLLDHQPGVRLDNDSETPDHPDVTGTCWCGWETRPELFAWRRREQHRAHQAATIVAALDDETARLRAKAWDEGAFEGLRTPRGFGWTLVNNPYRAALDPEETR